MSKDSSYHYVHLKQPRLTDLFEVYPSLASPVIFPPAQLAPEFNRGPHLTPEEIYVPAQHQPLNPEDEDDIVPDQHAAFGIQRATQTKKEPAWKDLGLEKLVNAGPGGIGERSSPAPLMGMVTGGTAMRRREGLGGGLPR